MRLAGILKKLCRFVPGFVEKLNPGADGQARDAIMALLEASGEMICGLDRRWRCLYVNPATERLAGQSRKQMLGRRLWEIFPGFHSSGAREALRRASGQNVAVEFQCVLPRLGVELDVHALPSAQGMTLVSHKAEPSEDESAAVDAAEAPAAKAPPHPRDAAPSRKRPPPPSAPRDQFLSMLSHELRTPLTPVVMTVAALEMDRTLPPRVRDDLAMIRRNIELETRLIDDLLDITRIAGGKLRIQREDADLHRAIEHVLEMLRGNLKEKQLGLSVDLSAGDAGICGDPARLQQIVWNVLNNAIKFTPAGGNITVRTWNASERIVGLEIIDDGAGIEAAMIPQLFDAFSQGERAAGLQFGGLGLGLAIARALVELHGGTIRAQSGGKDRGATFTLEFPTRAPIERLINKIQPLPPAAQPGRRPQILLVEDHLDTQRTLRRLLELQGYEVHTAATVKEGRTIIEHMHIDLIISDIGLPDESGLDLMRDARACRGPRIGGVAISGFGTDADRRASKDAGFLAHLVKPIHIHELDCLIHELLAKAAADQIGSDADDPSAVTEGPA